MDFRITEEQRRLQERCRQLAADFATRAAEHDRDASHPLENYDILRREGFYALNVPVDMGGSGVGLLGHTLAFEALAQGCQATALAFNMHLSIVGPLMENPEVSQAVKQRVADLVVHDKALIAGNFSETSSTALIGAHTPETRAKLSPGGGYDINGRKMFASMLSAADYVAAFFYPDEATAPTAGVLMLISQDAPGRSVNANWDTLGMPGYAQRFAGAGQLPRGRRGGAAAHGRHPSVSPRCGQLAVGVVHGGVLRRRRRRLCSGQRGDAQPPSARL